MVNHIRTLLLNESSFDIAESGARCWYVDDSFAPAKLSGGLMRAYSSIFVDAGSIDGKIDRINSVMPFVLDPEFDSYVGAFDRRSTVPSDSRPVGPSSIYDFYGTLSNDTPFYVDSVVSSTDMPSVFQSTGDTITDRNLSDLYKRYSYGFETTKRFSACVLAIVFRLDLLNKKSKA